MAILKLSISLDQSLKDGRYKIRISLSHKSSTRYIRTPYMIDSPSQFRNDQIINRPDSAVINSKLDHTEILRDYDFKHKFSII